MKLTQDQFDALVSFTFNVGEGNLQHSTLLQKVNAGDFAGAAREFAQEWNKAGAAYFPGLTRPPRFRGPAVPGHGFKLRRRAGLVSAVTQETLPR